MILVQIPVFNLKFLVVIFLTIHAYSFNIILPQPTTSLQSSKRCFTSIVFKYQRLHIEAQIPVLKHELSFILEVSLKKKQKKIIFSEIIKHSPFKKTIDAQHANGSLVNEDSLEYETCVFFKSNFILSTQKTDVEQIFASYILGKKQQAKKIQTYLISIKLMTNFRHELGEKLFSTAEKPSTHAYKKQNLQLLKKKSNKLLAIAQQQIKIHRVNQQIEIKTQEHVKALGNSIYSMSLIQSALLVFGSLLHVNLMSSYLKTIGCV